MSDTNNQEGFTPITSQEQLNSIIGERIKRAQESVEKKYADYVSPDDYQKALADANQVFDDYKKAHENDEQTIADLTAKNKAYETASLKSRIAHEVGLDYAWINRINGEDEKSIREDAESIKKLVGSGANNNLMPTKNAEAGEDYNSSTAALRSVLNGIKQN